MKLIRTWALLILAVIGSANVIAQNKTYFAIGTNALYDVVTIPNLEAEVAFADHWSILGECSFAWWQNKDKMDCRQLISGGLEGRYWFSSLNEAPLSGHFVGAFANLGAYDLERKGEGYQCRNAWMTGITYGYSFRLSQSWRLECSVGLGYMRGNKYDHYDEIEVNGKQYLMSRDRANLNWFGPTKAKVSFVWIPQLTKGKKGDMQ